MPGQGPRASLPRAVPRVLSLPCSSTSSRVPGGHTTDLTETSTGPVRETAVGLYLASWINMQLQAQFQGHPASVPDHSWYWCWLLVAAVKLVLSPDQGTSDGSIPRQKWSGSSCLTPIVGSGIDRDPCGCHGCANSWVDGQLECAERCVCRGAAGTVGGVTHDWSTSNHLMWRLSRSIQK